MDTVWERDNSTAAGIFDGTCWRGLSYRHYERLSVAHGNNFSVGRHDSLFHNDGTPADGQTLQAFAQACYVGKVRLIGAGAMGVAAIWTLIKLARPVIDGVKEAIQSARVPQEERKQHRTDADMSVRAIAIIFMIMFASLLGTFYSLVSANNLPFAQSMIISLVGVLSASCWR